MAEPAVAEQLDQLRQDLEVHEVTADVSGADQAPRAEAKPKRTRRRKATSTAKIKVAPTVDATSLDDEDVTLPTIVERLEQEARRNPLLTAAAMLGLGLALGRLLSR